MVSLVGVSLGRRAPALLAGAVAFAAGMTPAAAGRQDVIGVLDVQVTGVAPELAPRFEMAIEEGLGNAGARFAPRERMIQQMSGSSWVEGCVIGPCAIEVYKITRVERGLLVRVSAIGTTYNFVATLIDTRTGAPTAQVSQRCAVCTVDEALASATLTLIELVTSTPQIAAPAAALDAESRRATGAAVTAVEERLRDRRRATRRAALFMLGAAAIAGGVGVTYLVRDRDEIGYPAVGAGGAFAVASITMFAVSARF